MLRRLPSLAGRLGACAGLLLAASLGAIPEVHAPHPATSAPQAVTVFAGASHAAAAAHCEPAGDAEQAHCLACLHRLQQRDGVTPPAASLAPRVARGTPPSGLDAPPRAAVLAPSASRAPPLS